MFFTSKFYLTLPSMLFVFLFIIFLFFFKTFRYLFLFKFSDSASGLYHWRRFRDTDVKETLDFLINVPEVYYEYFKELDDSNVLTSSDSKVGRQKEL